MKRFSPYLRVVAGLFAAVCTWLVIVELIHGNIGEALVQLLMAAGLWYLAVGRPIRDHLARRKAENEAIAARAQAGHEAFLAGDPAAVFAAPPPAQEKRPVRRGVVIAAAVAAVLVLIGIIGDISDGLDDESDSVPTTSAQAATPAAAASRVAAAAPAPATTAPAPATTAPMAATTAPAPATTEPRAAATAAAPAVMPYVMCMNLQDAQDTIQEAGVFFSRSRDATGGGRSQIVDSNWVVVGQTPSAGSVFSEGDAVLSVVKYGEPGDCS